jgi:uracil-DNA glycosylase
MTHHAGGVSRAVPLPHPSGASSWVNLPPNKALLDRALALLAREFAQLGVTRHADRTQRSA